MIIEKRKDIPAIDWNKKSRIDNCPIRLSYYSDPELLMDGYNRSVASLTRNIDKFGVLHLAL